MKIEKVQTGLREEVEVFVPKALVEKPPGRFAVSGQHEEEIRRANGNRWRSAKRLCHGQKAWTRELKAIGELQRAIERASRVASDHDRRPRFAGDDLERLGPLVERHTGGVQRRLSPRIGAEKDSDVRDASHRRLHVAQIAAAIRDRVRRLASAQPVQASRWCRALRGTAGPR